ncbi:MAG TPA: ATPase, T2SS/T4P/T4SS family [Phycisphaerae bacterium]|nr:ATPase, T2SS/T4P/T4SS family [Phycisphaerae bacterium]
MVEMIADMPEFGGYSALVKFLVFLVFLAPWWYFATWVNRDATRLFGSATTWSGVVLGAGALGVLVWLVMPFFVVGLLFYAIVTGGAIGAYIVHRNGKVEPGKRVLTREHLGGAMKRRGRLDVQISTQVVLYDRDEVVVPPPDLSAENEQLIGTYNLVQDLLHDMVWRRASEAAITPSGNVARCLYVIDGVASERPSMSPGDSERIAQFLKDIAGMDLEDVRRPQKGKLSVDLDGARADVELSTAGTTGGQRMMFRFIQESVRTQLELLGLPEDILEEVRKLRDVDNGLFLVSGRRGAGVTSTLYAILRQRDAFMYNLFTLETAPAVDLENITQVSYGEEAKLTGALTMILNEGHADVLMIDQCSNADAAKMIAKVAAKMPVLLGIQAGDSFSALARWVQLCGDPGLAVRILRGISCQMLVRRLCTECREAYRPDPARLAKLNLAGEKIDVFYRPGKPTVQKPKGPVEVCPACQGSGYRGRTAVFELLKLTNDIRKLIIDGATVAQIRAACRKNKMLYLQEQTLRKVIDGTTSIEEVVRVTQQTKKK